MKSRDGLWAITCYYNPLRYRRRLPNYRTFRAHLELPLVTVEAVYGNEPDLTAADAELLIQRHGRDVLWQKERLLNIAVKALPPECDRVVILDADVVFTDPDWPQRVYDALDEGPLCQAFHYAYEAPRDRELPTPLRGEGPVERSLASWLAEGTTLRELFDSELNLRERGCCPGIAWAAHQSLLESHGLYEACILGGAYPAIACAAYGEFELVETYLEMNAAQQAHFRAWAEPFHAEVRGRLGFAENTLLHLWHGELPRRYYRERHSGMVPFDFDPHEDLAVADSGCLRWATDKPAMHDYVRVYFGRRREDG
jgi:hypothetical protein